MKASSKIDAFGSFAFCLDRRGMDMLVPDPGVAQLRFDEISSVSPKF